MSRELDVSRETLSKLEAYAELLRKWSPKINLVAKSTLDDIWQRHILDSAQVHHLAPTGGAWVDIGSGGGLPGMVCCIMGAETNRHFRFIESDARKCVFLRTALRELELTAEVVNARIEHAPPAQAKIVSARALAPLELLLGYVHRHVTPDGVAILQKGENWETEVQIARKTWQFDCEAVQSETKEGAVILKVSKVQNG